MKSVLTSATAFSLALGFVSAAPTTPQIQCSSKPQLTETISPSAASPYDSIEAVYFGLGNTTTDHNGVQSKVLISTKDDGSTFTSKDQGALFDFYPCQSTYMGKDRNGQYSNGLLKPAGDTENCVQTKTGSVDTSDQVMVVASCSLLDDASQQQQTWAYYPGAFANVKFVSTRWGSNQRQHPTHFQRSTVSHHALKLLSGEGDIYEGSADFATLDFPHHA